MVLVEGLPLSEGQREPCLLSYRRLFMYRLLHGPLSSDAAYVALSSLQHIDVRRSRWWPMIRLT
jgi:hypothetical protein